jgi:hypothetical protein
LFLEIVGDATYFDGDPIILGEDIMTISIVDTGEVVLA